jgi:hypothetical protein
MAPPRINSSPAYSWQEISPPHDIAHVSDHDVKETAYETTDDATNTADEAPSNVLDGLRLPVAELAFALGVGVKNLPFGVFVCSHVPKTMFHGGHLGAAVPRFEPRKGKDMDKEHGVEHKRGSMHSTT